METRIENPFLVSGYESPAFFCDREKETADLLETLRNGRNVTLTSPRRIGKTGLIKHLFYTLKQQDPKAVVIYIDLFPTDNLAGFTHAFASAVFGQLDSNPTKVLKTVASIFKGLRPHLTLYEVTGKPLIELDIVKGTETYTLEQVFAYLKQSGKECFIAFDEFQQISHYPEQHVEAPLRSYVQDLHQAHFIFSGSQVHMLQEMFLSPKRPFYQSTSEITIGAIAEKPYYDFASEFFRRQGRVLPEEVFSELYRRYEGFTWYIQMILNRIYAKSARTIDLDLVQECVLDILKENDYYYQHLIRVYPKGQVKLIKAIALEKKVREITSGAFVAKYGLTATSSVKSALKRMLEEEIVYCSEEVYMVYDRFFGERLDTTFSVNR